MCIFTTSLVFTYIDIQPAERHSLLLWDEHLAEEDLESGIVHLFLHSLKHKRQRSSNVWQGGQGRSRTESHRGKAGGHEDEGEGNEEEAERYDLRSDKLTGNSDC